MNSKTAWEKAADAQGTTESERALVRLARKAFLSLWSYPNVYSDEGKCGDKGDGKEVADLLVVFGDNVLLFSDKHCAYPTKVETKVAWPRWYKRTIEKSAKQLAGAESFLRRFPQRIFIDKDCRTRLPVKLPDPSVARYFLIAVTRGGYEATVQHFGGRSSGSLMLNNSLVGDTHYEHPFKVGFPLKDRRFVHVLDEVTVDALLEELDTVPDLVDYLACKERYFANNDVLITIAGEEELLARYMCTTEGRHHALPKIPAGTNFVSHMEGDWEFYRSSPQRAAKREADRISYMWEDLIEYQASFVRAGTAIGLPEIPPESIGHERVLRALASEPRLARRMLATQLRGALEVSVVGQKFARMVLSASSPSRAYVFLTAPKPDDIDYQDYREMRSAALLTYCQGIKRRFPQVTEAIGIASEPLSATISSQDFVYFDLKEDLSPRELDDLKEWSEHLDVLQTPAEDLKYFGSTLQEFPMPFSFGGPTFLDQESGIPMNRAERRRMASEARRQAKRAKKKK